MPISIYSSFYLQVILFVLFATVLVVSAVSLFIKPAKRTIRASLVKVSNGHIIDISHAETSIGRAKSCDVTMNVMSVSRFHAVLSKRKSGWMIFDTNSTGGIIVNGQKIEKKSELNDGDSIMFGDEEYVFYSTAVTTRQQVIPKNGKTPGQCPPQRKYNADSDDEIQYKRRKNTGRRK